MNLARLSPLGRRPLSRSCRYLFGLRVLDFLFSHEFNDEAVLIKRFRRAQ